MKLLLADERVDVNQANMVRMGGEGRGRVERAGREGRRVGAGCSACAVYVGL